jgi:hypothetical protein
MSADPHRVDEDHWWTISVTAMSEAEAIAAAREIRERFPHVYADAVDPRFFMTTHTDRSTTQLLRDGLAALAAEGRDCGSMIEIIDSWLAQTYPDDEAQDT